MKIAIDFDGTIADTNVAKSNYLLLKFGKEIPPASCNRTICVPIIGESAYEEMSESLYSQAATLQTPPVLGAIESTKMLAQFSTLYVVTARKTKWFNVVPKWLELYGLEDCVREVINTANGRSKAEICRELSIDALIDDDARHLYGLSSHCVKILFGADECPIDLSAEIARSWKDILRILGMPDKS